MEKHRKTSRNGLGPATKADTDVLPSFDERALSALTEKIEKGFGKTKAPQQLADTGSGNHKKARSNNVHGNSDSKTKAKEPEHNRGKKRDAQGNVKAGKGKAEISSYETNTKNRGADEDRDALLKEILALGGTEDDLDLVADAASDEEGIEGDNGSAQDKSFKKDLAKFVAGLGIEGAVVEDASESEAEQEEEGEDEWEEASDLDSPEESGVPNEPEGAPKKPAPALPNTKSSDASLKGPSRLVSMSPL